MKKRHVIIGASAASIGALSKLRALAPDDEITCVTAQQEMPFNTCLLANYLSTGIMPATLYTKPQSFFTRNNIQLHLNSKVREILPKEQCIIDANANKYFYDTLFLGVGNIPLTASTDFKAQSGYFRFHTLNDVVAIDSFLRTQAPKTALVIGAGLSGIECADALAERGLYVTVIDTAAHPLAMLIEKPAGEMLDLMMKRHNTTFYGEMKVSKVLVEPFSGKTQGVLLDNDIEIYADMVISAIGCKANLEISLQAVPHITLGGIPVNNALQTATPGIYCGGDAATVPTPLHTNNSPHAAHLVRSCTWPDAMQQGMIAGQNMAGKQTEYPGAIVILSSHFFGTQVVSTSNLSTKDKNPTLITHQGENWYHHFILSNERLVAFFMLGNIRNVGVYRKLIGSQEPFDLSLLDPLKDIPYVSEK